MLWLCWFWLFESHLRTSRTPQRGLLRWTLHTATSTLRYNSASNCSLTCIAFEQTLLNVRMLSVSFERKGLQALFQRLSINVPPQWQGMCLPEGQSIHGSTCCIGYRLPYWLHSQQPFWFEQCFLQALSILPFTLSTHYTTFSRQWYVLPDLKRRCLLTHIDMLRQTQTLATS